MPPSSQASVEPSSAASRLEWAAAGLLAANLGWTVCCLGGYRPETKVVSACLTAAALIALLLDRLVRPAVPRWHPVGFWLLPFAALTVANVLWVTPVRWLGWLDAWGWLQLAATVWVALNIVGRPGPRSLITGALVVLVGIEFVAACYQRFVDPAWLAMGRTQSYQFIGRSAGTFGIPNSLAAFFLLLLPPALIRTVRGPAKVVAGAVALCAAAGLLLTLSRGVWLSLALALAAWPLLDSSKSWRRRLGVSGAVAGGALLAFGALFLALPDVRGRVEALARDGGERTRPMMWSGAWRLFLDAPVFGTGAGSYNVLFERHRPEGFRDDPQWAHNEYLNTLSDHGAAGFTLAFVLPAAALLRARLRGGERGRATSEERAWGVGLLGFAFSLALDFHLKLPGLAMTAAVAFAVWCGRWTTGARRRIRRANAFGRRTAALGVAAAVCVSMFVVVLPVLRAESLRYGARRAIDAWAEGRQGTIDASSLLVQARGHFADAIVVDSSNGQTWADLSYTLSLMARHDASATRRLGVEAEAAARQALAGSDAAAEFWWRLGVALDMQSRWAEAGAAFARAIELAPHHPLGWYYQAYHYSLNPATRALALPSLATCLRLDPGYAPAESLREVLQARP